MITLALLLAGIGIADLIRALTPVRWSAIIAGAVSAVLVLAGTLAAGIAWWWALIIVALGCGWLASTSEPGPGERGTGERGTVQRSSTVQRGTVQRSSTGLWPIAGLAAAVAIAFTFAPALPAAGGVLLDWYEWLPYEASAATPFDTFALAVGGVLLLLETANVIVRIVLRRTAPETTANGVVLDVTGNYATAADAAASTPPRPRFSLRLLLSPPPPATPAAPADPVAAVSTFTLKGGRIIGPLERLFILSLALGGQFTAIGAVIAAKGIIRFPEISKDSPGGSKAEYFLVGSFASWALVLAIAVLLKLSA